MTYTALVTLIILGDDLSRLNKQAMLSFLKNCQAEQGSFRPHPGTTENDMRFLYCACVISFILKDFSSVNKDSAYNFIMNCKSYDGGFSQKPNCESHGGSTFCALASLSLMGLLNSELTWQEDCLDWCIQRQGKGFSGRIGKPEDTCYAFWVGGSIAVI
jgi:geranylgeranyl transferase type-1 subunit beta